MKEKTEGSYFSAWNATWDQKVTERKTNEPEFLTALWKHHNSSGWPITNFSLFKENDTPNLFISLFFGFLEQLNMIPKTIQS